MQTFHTCAIDEYGIFYAAQTLHSADEIEAEINSLKDALEDASVSRSYAIRSVIEDLEEQLSNYKETPD